MKLEFQPVRVATRSEDQEGVLAFANGQLVAVLVRLSELHADLAGSWFLEAGFGTRETHLTFRDLDAAEEWLSSGEFDPTYRHLEPGSQPG
jgi:hypothetical protein